MNKENLLFIDHSYHQKTKSSKFFQDFLKDYFNVEIIYDDGWKKNNKNQLKLENLDKYSNIILFQNLPNRSILEQIQNKNVIFVPMYDEVQNWDYFKWQKVKNFKILCFSKTIYELLDKYNFNTFYIQYFIQSKDFSIGEKNSCFLWQRINSINIDTIKHLAGNYLKKIHIHKAIDPNHKQKEISKEDIEKYNISTSTWFET
ncbi:hypothetical protein IJ670_04175, partial [bacterium]|nr:hypothetical protein [bacterium]